MYWDLSNDMSSLRAISFCRIEHLPACGGPALKEAFSYSVSVGEQPNSHDTDTTGRALSEIGKELGLR